MLNLILIVDAVINLFFGLLLAFIPGEAIQFFCVPPIENTFYPRVLGSILVGIGIALFLESSRRSHGFIGLGLGGAVIINICAGCMLAVWLLFGKLNIPLRGQVFLWMLTIVLILISSIEIIIHLKQELLN